MLIKCIAIDFDDTYTSDTRLWHYIILTLQSAEITVICATARSWSEANERDMLVELPNKVKVVFCGNQYKRDATLAAGYDVQIWIDDTPEAIVNMRPGILWLIRLKSLLHSTKDAIKRYYNA